MLIVELKSKNEISSFCTGNTLLITCSGCSEVYFPYIIVNNICNELSETGNILDIIRTGYICNPDTLLKQADKYLSVLNKSDSIVVFACGVGVQTVSDKFTGKRVFSGCDTFPLPGFQGVTPPEFDCNGCGDCQLNLTYGICPVTSCSKSLKNGQCGGSSKGMCEVDNTMECCWERIYKRSLSKKV